MGRIRVMTSDFFYLFFIFYVWHLGGYFVGGFVIFSIAQAHPELRL